MHVLVSKKLYFYFHWVIQLKTLNSATLPSPRTFLYKVRLYYMANQRVKVKSLVFVFFYYNILTRPIIYNS